MLFITSLKDVGCFPSSHPALTWQQALNEPADSSPAVDIRALLDSGEMERGLSLMEWQNKPATTDPCTLTITNLPEVVTCVALDKDSRYLACGSKDCVVRIYEMSTGKVGWPIPASPNIL